MKKLLFYISCICLFVVCCTSCSSDSEEGIGGDTPILLSAQTLDGMGVRSIIAGGQALPTGLAVGVYIAENGGTNLPIASNQKYTVNATGGLIGAVQYYPQSGNGVKISAYYPYNGGSGNSYDFKVAVDQSTDANYNASDLLYSAESSYVRQTAVHSLAFAHKLSRITYQLKSGNNAPSLANAVVSIVDVYPDATFDRSTGVLDVVQGTKTAITPHASGAIVVPQTIAAGTRLIEVEAGGNKYYYKPTAALSMESGKSYDFEITVQGTELQVTYTVSAWETGTVNDNGGAISARSYRVGDYYPDPNVDLNNAEEKAKIQGIVFWLKDPTDGRHGKIVSLDETSKKWDEAKDWCTAKGTSWSLPAKDELKALYAGYSGKRYEDITDWGDFAVMQGYDATACQDARTAFNTKLTTASGAEFTSAWYWSSSESEFNLAWIVFFSAGGTDTDGKFSGNRVRAVSAF